MPLAYSANMTLSLILPQLREIEGLLDRPAEMPRSADLAVAFSLHPDSYLSAMLSSKHVLRRFEPLMNPPKTRRSIEYYVSQAEGLHGPRPIGGHP